MKAFGRLLGCLLLLCAGCESPQEPRAPLRTESYIEIAQLDTVYRFVLVRVAVDTGNTVWVIEGNELRSGDTLVYKFKSQGEHAVTVFLHGDFNWNESFRDRVFNVIDTAVLVSGPLSMIQPSADIFVDCEIRFSYYGAWTSFFSGNYTEPGDSSANVGYAVTIGTTDSGKAFVTDTSYQSYESYAWNDGDRKLHKMLEWTLNADRSELRSFRFNTGSTDNYVGPYHNSSADTVRVHNARLVGANENIALYRIDTDEIRDRVGFYYSRLNGKWGENKLKSIDWAVPPKPYALIEFRKR